MAAKSHVFRPLFYGRFKLLLQDVLLCELQKPLLFLLLVVYVFDDIGNSAVEQFAQLINGIGGNAVSLPDTVVGGPAEAFFLQPVRGDLFVFHCLKQWSVTYHM